MKKTTIIYLLLVVFLLGVAFVVLTLSTGRTTFFGKASGSGAFSSSNSYVFASPLTARAGGDKIRITVFALDSQGKGISGKSVSVDCADQPTCQNAGVLSSAVQPQTDSLGQAIFDFSGQNPGQFELQAKVDGVVIPQTVSVSFQ